MAGGMRGRGGGCIGGGKIYQLKNYHTRDFSVFFISQLC